MQFLYQLSTKINKFDFFILLRYISSEDNDGCVGSCVGITVEFTDHWGGCQASNDV